MENITNINTEIEKIEREIFMLEMKDHWSSSDYFRKNELRSKLNELRKQAQNEG